MVNYTDGLQETETIRLTIRRCPSMSDSDHLWPASHRLWSWGWPLDATIPRHRSVQLSVTRLENHQETSPKSVTLVHGKSSQRIAQATATRKGLDPRSRPTFLLVTVDLSYRCRQKTSNGRPQPILEVTSIAIATWTSEWQTHTHTHGPALYTHDYIHDVIALLCHVLPMQNETPRRIWLRAVLRAGIIGKLPEIGTGDRYSDG